MNAAFRLALLAGMLVLALRQSSAEQLVVALSTDHVKISSSFTGTGVTVFGAIERDAGTISRGGVYDIVVVVRGPDETLVTRRKERVAGIWLNRAARTFLDMPSFYAVHSSRPLNDIAPAETLTRYQIGFDYLAFRAREGRPEPGDEAFRDAFVRLKREAGLYRDAPYGVTFPGSAVFQTTVDVPANVPVGTYRVSVFLFRDSAMLAANSAAFGIAKTGFEQFTFDLARRNGYFYGLICIALALLTGWLAGVLFRRD
ncbi:conserved hypothetical protein [Kaistia soli DSM 19436]|uniref:TIGR02186 family protein n=1 Tax=Kaistia soli DSM 19436 TaxID=1122133 RepID=A0A1M5LDB9_9HYPH|nr:TIGR02186 family protein [Kaistia soli]SHG63018.1 conserved hypothetical protein [Kaistia soli DSM 19436]